MQKKNKAALALGVSVAGCLGTLPFSPTGGMAWGILHHGFLAAMIGGLADWFAVTAIFRKPLGIGFRTDILRRNRERIMDSLVQFAAEDLLNAKNVMDILRKQDLAEMLVSYLTLPRGRHGRMRGRDKLKKTLSDVLLKAVNTADMQAVAREIEPFIGKGVKALAPEKLLSDAIRIFSKEEHSAGPLYLLLLLTANTLSAPFVQQVMLLHIKNVREAYLKDSATREMVFSLMDITDERIRNLLNEKISEQMGELLAGESKVYELLKKEAEKMLLHIADQAENDAQLADFYAQFAGKIDFQEILANWLQKNLQGDSPIWLEPMQNFLDQKIDEFIASDEWRRRCDSFIKDFIESELGKHRDLLTNFVRERMDKFSDDELIEFIETRVDDDLQMIRINGSIVGAMVGMGLYLMVTLAERLWF